MKNNHKLTSIPKIFEMQQVIDPKFLKDEIEKISSFGNRWVGSEGEKSTRRYLFKRFQELGLEDVEIEEFDCLRYTPKHSKLSVETPLQETIPCFPLEYSGDGVVKGEIVYVADGSEESIRALKDLGYSLEGKIALLLSDTPAFRIPKLLEEGVAGFVVATDAPEDLIPALAAKTYPPELEDPMRWRLTVPGVIISRKSLHRLLSLMSVGKVIVEIRHESEYSIEKTGNVIGILKGLEEEKMIVVGAHYDSQIKGIGVWDNLTGTSLLLALAQFFRSKRLKKSLVFIAFGAEEIGLWGSTVYVENHLDELKEKCLCMLCMDAVSSAYPAERSLWSEGWLKDFIMKVCEENGVSIENTHRLNLSYSDYYPFKVKGIPSAMLWEHPPVNPYYHTEKDTIRYVDVNKLAFMGTLYAKIISSLDEL